MPYVTRVLQPGETFLYAAKLSGLIYARAVFLMIICVILAVASWFMADNQNVFLALAIGAIIFAIFAVSSWIRALIRRKTTELVVTDRRVIYKSGIFARHTREMNRSKVEGVDVHQSIPGRLFGYGNIVVRGTGGNFEPFSYISNPLAFRSHITAD